MTTAQVKAVRATITQARMSTYDVAVASGEARTRRALKLYLWNAEIAAAFLFPLHLCEVAVRNAVADAIAAQYGARWPWATGFQQSLPTSKTGYSPRGDLVGARRNVSSTGKVIPEVKFVFWQKMFTSRYDNAIWDHQLMNVLPGADPSGDVPTLRTRVYDDLDRIRLLRNRIAHHEPIIGRDLAADLAAINDLVCLRCGDTSQLVQAVERVSTILPDRPL
ncbi:hypothetical protein [Rhodococcus ruber]|uniref:hypothetical protein n=1 Tax=Rhodococcus ruber TaxID=1830 RepID=UPI000E6AEE1A|nr:hypothetical protein [Rhodococcus ruber]